VLEYTLYSPDDVSVELKLQIQIKELLPALTNDFTQDISFGTEKALKNQDAKVYEDSNGVEKTTTIYYDIEVTGNASLDNQINIPIQLGNKNIQQGNNLGYSMTIKPQNESNLMIDDGFINYNSQYTMTNGIVGDSIFVFSLDYYDGIMLSGENNYYTVKGFVRVFKSVTSDTMFSPKDVELTNVNFNLDEIKPNSFISGYSFVIDWADIDSNNILTIKSANIDKDNLSYSINIVQQKYKDQNISVTISNKITFHRRFITTEKQLLQLNEASSQGFTWYILNDIYMAGTYNNKSPVSKFSGTLNGNNHAIYNSNVKINNEKFSSEKTFGGIFGELNGNINNLKLKNINITSASIHSGSFVLIGGLAGKMTGGMIDNVTVQVNIDIDRALSTSGGIVGSLESGTITNSSISSNTSIFSNGDIGGIAGWNKGTIKNSYSYASISYYYINDNARSVDGIVGYNNSGKVSGVSSYGYLENTHLGDRPIKVEAKIGTIIGDNTGGTYDGLGNRGSWDVTWTYSNGFLGIGKYNNGKYILKLHEKRVGKE